MHLDRVFAPFVHVSTGVQVPLKQTPLKDGQLMLVPTISILEGGDCIFLFSFQLSMVSL